MYVCEIETTSNSLDLYSHAQCATVFLWIINVNDSVWYTLQEYAQ